MAVHLNRQEGMPAEIEEIVGGGNAFQSEEPLEGLRYALFKVSARSRSGCRAGYRSDARLIWPRQRLSVHLRVWGQGEVFHCNEMRGNHEVRKRCRQLLTQASVGNGVLRKPDVGHQPNVVWFILSRYDNRLLDPIYLAEL